MNRSGVPLLLAALLSGCGDPGGPGPDPIVPIGQGPRILFLGGSPPHLYLVHANGGGLKQLTSGPRHDGAAFWSHDGTRIYFNQDNGAPPYLYVMNADGSNQQVITSLPRGEGDAWSPDATRKAFPAFMRSADDPLDQEQLDLYVMNADSTDLVRVVDLRDPWNCTGFTDCSDIASFAWSPTGEWIAFSTWITGRGGSASSSLGLVSPDGQQLRYLVDNTASGGRWSPDGRLLAYSDGENGYIPRPRDIAVVGLGGESPAILVDGTANSTVNFSPVWTADGSQIVFSRSPIGVPDSSEIWIVGADGSGLHRLTGLPVNADVQDVNPRDSGTPSFP